MYLIYDHKIPTGVLIKQTNFTYGFHNHTIMITILTAIGGLHQTVLRSKTDAMRSERTKLIQL